MANSEAQLRACEFLLSKQCADGGWGESYLSCQDKARRGPTCQTLPGHSRVSMGMDQGAVRDTRAYLAVTCRSSPRV